MVEDICYSCGQASETSVRVGIIKWFLCTACSATAIPKLIADDANNTLTAVNTFDSYGILGDWAKDVVFEVPKAQALFETPHKAVISPDGSVYLHTNNHLTVDVTLNGSQAAKVHLENLARNNCDVRGEHSLIDHTKFTNLTQSLANATSWHEGLAFLKNVEDSFTVIGSFVQS